MFDEHGTVLYIGKAKNLKKRVTAYTQYKRHPVRLQRMIRATRTMEFVITQSETEALLLEASLIKRFLIAQAPSIQKHLRMVMFLAFIVLAGKAVSKSSFFGQVKTGAITVSFLVTAKMNPPKLFSMPSLRNFIIVSLSLKTSSQVKRFRNETFLSAR